MSESESEYAVKAWPYAAGGLVRLFESNKGRYGVGGLPVNIHWIDADSSDFVRKEVARVTAQAPIVLDVEGRNE